MTRQPDANGFHHYRHADDTTNLRNGSPPPRPVQTPRPLQDWQAEAKRHADAFTTERRGELARALGLPVWALDAIPQLGWSGKAWTFPECDGSGRVTGIGTRSPDGAKKMIFGGRRGLIVPAGWRDRPGPVFVVEGASDTLALSAAGLAAVGRPNNIGGGDLLAELLRDLPADRPVIVLGENDRKANGEWPGKEGAERVAGDIGKGLGRPVRIAYPPEDLKDARAWVLDLASGQAETEDWPAVGAAVVAHATREPKPKSIWPDPVPVSQLPDHGPVADWLLNGVIARGHLSLIAAHPKAGKTTLVSHLLKALQVGAPFVGRETKECRTLYVSEESQSIWRGRRDALDLDDHLHLICRPMFAKPTPTEWASFIEHVHRLAVGGFDQVVIDTISTFAPWKSENDNAEITAAFNPLFRLTEAGKAVTIFHHFGKAEGSGGRALRGGSALAGAVDVMIELRRFKPDDMDDRRRVLAGLGRFDEIPAEMVVTLEADGSGYTACGDRKAEAAKELRAVLLDSLPTTPPGMAANDIHAAMDATARPRRSAVLKALTDGWAAASWHRTGTGKPKDPWRFWRE